ncbi:hypothetical protein HXX76_012672 [Chlamydomonas incerta]|uniref:ABC transporter domain-containing protein n=1 Tax=Chlamydomonas incerta TaxID=51695 RepID=A0A835SU93_CHLIN|nr:hypothetical protein HXX76_012672 [Chlamydomonas incerta]|eukprot:KAG2426885.1 hypothetical protein HXX76_012672 [Chlamydomonas incerta]
MSAAPPGEGGGGGPDISPELARSLTQIEPSSAILPLWLPMVVFGHAFAIAFLIHGLLLYQPRLRRLLSPRALWQRCCGCWRARRSAAKAAAPTASAASAASATPPQHVELTTAAPAAAAATAAAPAGPMEHSGGGRRRHRSRQGVDASPAAVADEALTAAAECQRVTAGAAAAVPPPQPPQVRGLSPPGIASVLTGGRLRLRGGPGSTSSRGGGAAATDDNPAAPPAGEAADDGLKPQRQRSGGGNGSAAGSSSTTCSSRASSSSSSSSSSRGEGSEGEEGEEELAAPSEALVAALGYEDEEEDSGGAGSEGGGGGGEQHYHDGVGPVCLEWRHVTLAVAAPRGVVAVLRDVGGRAPAGTLTALLGPSGAGKSTLLDLLALRGGDARPLPGAIATAYPPPDPASPEDPEQPALQLPADAAAAAALQQGPAYPDAYHSPSEPGCTGEVLVNGRRREVRAFLSMSSYVPQEDAFLPQLTVREALTFTGRLVLRPPQCKPAAVAARAAAVAAALGLGGCLDTMIGGVLPGGLLLRGLSGGERKRLSIGQGLMSRPRVLLLDEPTSGLDSFAAAVVVGHVAALAAGGHGGGAGGVGDGAAGGGSGGSSHNGVTVIASLHQPRAAIWEQVGQVVVLGRGRLLYCGPPDQLLPWFTVRLGYGYCPEAHGLVPDWIMDLVALPGNDSGAGAGGGGGGGAGGAGGKEGGVEGGVDASGELGGGIHTGGSSSRPGATGATATPDAAPASPGTATTASAAAAAGAQDWSTASRQQLEAAATVAAADSYSRGPSGALLRRRHGAAGSSAATPVTGRGVTAIRCRGFSVLGSSRSSSTGGGGGGGSSAGGAPDSPCVMSSLRELDAAADTFAAAALAPPPAPGVSAGVPDYANALAAAAAAAAPAAATEAAAEAAGATAGAASVAQDEDVRHAPAVAAAAPAAAAADSTQHVLVHVHSGAGGGGPHTSRRHGGAEGGGAATGGGAVRYLLSAAEGWGRQYRMLVWREWLMATRNPADVAGRMLVFVWVGLFSNFLTYSLPADASSILLRANLLFALVFFFIVMPFIFMSLFTADKRFFMSEASARGGSGGLYTVSAYYAAKVTATSPLNIAIALTFDWIGYGMLGYRRSVLAVAQNAACAVLLALIAMQWVQASVAFSPNQDLAFCASVAFAVWNLLLSTQFLGPAPLTFKWIARLRAISALDHAWRGCMTAEFRNRAFVCGPPSSAGMQGTDALGLYPQFLPTNDRFGLVRMGMTMVSEPCVVDTDGLLTYFKINTPVGVTVGYLFAYLAVVHAITYLALRRAVAAAAGSGAGGGGGGGGGGTGGGLGGAVRRGAAWLAGGWKRR